MRLNEKPTTMGIMFFSWVSNKTGAVYPAGAYKDILNNNLETDPGKIIIAAIPKDGEKRKDFLGGDIEIYFLINEEITEDYTLVYEETNVSKEYPLSKVLSITE